MSALVCTRGATWGLKYSGDLFWPGISKQPSGSNHELDQVSKALLDATQWQFVNLCPGGATQSTSIGSNPV
jgi:hypothetical protein